MTGPAAPGPVEGRPAGLRVAGVGDAAPIARLERELFADEAWSEAQVVEELTGYGRRGWVVDSCVRESNRTHVHSAPAGEGDLASATHPLEGYVIMRTVGDVADLQRIGVSTSAQRHGHASALLAAGVAGVRADGAERILLEVAEDNTAARAFYARTGFVEIDRRRNYYRQRVDALVLALELGATGSAGPAE